MTTETHDDVTTSPRWARPAIALVAALSPAIVFLLVSTIGGVDVAVPESFGSEQREELELGAVIGASVIAVLVGWGVLAVLERLTDKALTIWTVGALVLAAISMPWSTGFRTSDRVVITLMHVAIAAVFIVGMRVTSPRAAHSRVTAA